MGKGMWCQDRALKQEGRNSGRIQNSSPHPFLRKARHLGYKIIREGFGQKERGKNSVSPPGGSPSPHYPNVPEAEQSRVKQSCSSIS